MNDTTLDIEKPAGTSSLAEPLTLPCGVTLRNRLAKSAMSEQLGTLQNNPTEQLTTLYGRWGRSGLGMNITGNVMVDRRSLGEPLNVVVEDDRDFTMLQAWANAAKADGAAAIVQINHPGRQIPRGLSSHVVAPSAVQVKLPGAPMPKPRALTSEEVTEQVERFATTAEIVTRAGFDGVQLHGAHGYLISQFLSPIVNLREDQWGGDAERRSRFLIEIVRAVRQAIGPDKILSVKLNSADFQRGGFSEDESLAVIALLESEGVDLLEISGGSYERPAMTGSEHAKAEASKKASTRAREAYFLEFAERARATTEMPLMITGGLRSGAAMREARAAGIDVIGIARPMCLEPDLPHALLSDPNAKSELKPISTGIRKLDPAAELWWNGQQLRRMANGKEPNLRLGSRRAALRAVLSDGANTMRRKRGS